MSTTDYITVLNDFDIEERLEVRDVSNQSFKDGTLTFRHLPPLISGLQSVYADLSGSSTISMTFTPTVEASSKDATISTYLWESQDGIISSTSTKDTSILFPGAATREHRWVRLTVTDDNSVSQYFVFEVYTVALLTSSVAWKLATRDIQISGTRQDGYNATVRAFAGVSSIINRSRCAIVSSDDYGGIRALAFTSGGTTTVAINNNIVGETSAAQGRVVSVELTSGSWGDGTAAGILWIDSQVGTFQSETLKVGSNLNVASVSGNSTNPTILQNIAFVGRVRKSTDEVFGDQLTAKRQSVSFTLEGPMTQLGRIIGPGIQIESISTPTIWGQVDELTVQRALIYMLAWHTTFLTLHSTQFQSDLNDYLWPVYTIPPGPANQWVNSVSDDINAFMMFTPDGQCGIFRHASYAGVDGLTVVMQFNVDSNETSDTLQFTVDEDVVPTVSYSLGG
ncbi:MAG: hypothetical protein HC888_07470, partial [Candidatus Competibacteraceae bacterium]|nr:hypothetical protein [Candidatus Competibacteraceae bacterium]